MIPKKARIANPQCSLHEGADNQDGQEVHDSKEGNDHENNKGWESLSGADIEEKGKELGIIMHGDHGPATANPPLIVKDEMQQCLSDCCSVKHVRMSLAY